MECLCGAPMIPTRTDILFDALPGSMLMGVWVFKCPKCGDYFHEFPRLGKLLDIVDSTNFPNPERTRFRFTDGEWSYQEEP